MQLPEFLVFVKPWPLPLEQVAKKVKTLGFDGIELPIRAGFPVNPDNVGTALKEAVRIFSEQGLSIRSVAGSLTEPLFAACSEAGVPLVRICVQIPNDKGYMETEDALKREYEALIPSLIRHGVTIGIQNHCDRFVANAMGIRHLIEGFSPNQFAAVWDAAHSAICGEDPDLGIDIVWTHLKMVNLKNVVWKKIDESEAAQWKRNWTSGRQGLASWPKVVRELARRNYQSPVCLTAEYSDEASVDLLIAEDIAFARELFAREYQKFLGQKG